MVKIILVIYAITVSGPVVKPVAEFPADQKAKCELVGQQVLKELKQNSNIRVKKYACVERTAS